MGMIGSMMKVGMAKKAFSAARKPENQRKVKEMVAKVRGKRGSK